jgi:hypothetical protein
MRTARCSYYGKKNPSNKFQNGGCREDVYCKCERSGNEFSNENLPFFAKRPDKEHDEFYCGCQGWD